MRCRMTASFRATATLALRSPLRFASRHPDRNWLLVRGPFRRGGHADRAGGISVYRGETAERVLRHHMLRFQRDRVMAEDELRKLIGGHGFTIANLSCRLIEGGQQFEYRMTIKSQDRKNGERLAVHLRGLPEVVEFRIAPTGD